MIFTIIPKLSIGFNIIDQNIKRQIILHHDASNISANENYLNSYRLSISLWSHFQVNVSWEPEGRYCCSKMFRWEQEGRYRCTKSMAIAPFWFSTDHRLSAIMPFWLSTDVKLSRQSHIYVWWFSGNCVGRGYLVVAMGSTYVAIAGCTWLFKCGSGSLLWSRPRNSHVNPVIATSTP